MTRIYRLHDVVKRLDNGRPVCIVDVRPVGDCVFYQVEDQQDGQTAMLDGSQLRPLFTWFGSHADHG